MAPSGPVFSTFELKALIAYVQVFLHAAEVARGSKFDGLSPTERWKPFGPNKAAKALPPRVDNLFARYAWHRAGAPAASNAIAHDLMEGLSANGFDICDVQLDGALVAGAYWLNPPKDAIFNDAEGLLALERFVGLVNGYMQTLPPRFAPNEHPDSRNQRFRAYQRRRNGDGASTRPPNAIVRRFPVALGELLDAYQSQLLETSPEAAGLLASNVAVALCRPVDVVAAAQVEIALASALIWRNLSDFPVSPKSHALLGERPEGEGAELWNAAASRIADAHRRITTNKTPAVGPKALQTAAGNLVGSIDLDAVSLDALSLLDDYVTAFASWIRTGVAKDVPAEQRVGVFDRSYRRSTGNTVGSTITGALPSTALKVIAQADAMITRQRDLKPLAEQLARALGDPQGSERLRRTLETSAAWLNGGVSRLERLRTENAANQSSGDPIPSETLDAFKLARQRDAEALLDMGAAITELVSFSQTLDKSGRPPVGWWIRFTNERLADGHSPLKILLRGFPMALYVCSSSTSTF